MQGVMPAQDQPRQNARAVTAAARELSRSSSNRGKFPNFTTMSHCVPVARVAKQGQHHKLLSAPTGPWRVVNLDRDCSCIFQNIVNGRRVICTLRKRVSCGGDPRATTRLRDIFQRLKIRGISAVKKARWRMDALCCFRVKNGMMWKVHESRCQESWRTRLPC